LRFVFASFNVHSLKRKPTIEKPESPVKTVEPAKSETTIPDAPVVNIEKPEASTEQVDDSSKTSGKISIYNTPLALTFS
jgi:hypothetical protein